MTAAATLRRLRSTGRALKLKVWQAIVKAQLVYGAETWCMTRRMRLRVDSFGLRWLRRITGMLPVWVQKYDAIRYPPNAEVLAAAKVPKMSDQIDAQRLRFLGHVLRRSPEDAVKRSFHDSCPIPGRPGFALVNTLKSQLHELMTEAALSEGAATDKVAWRAACKNLLDARYRASCNPALED